jgi:hypothetical protein
MRILVTLLGSLLICSTAFAAEDPCANRSDKSQVNVRGMIVFNAEPVSRIGVSIGRPESTEREFGYSFTGKDGMYYMYTVPPGPYILRVHTNPIRNYKIVVKSCLEDIAPIDIQ